MIRRIFYPLVYALSLLVVLCVLFGNPSSIQVVHAGTTNSLCVNPGGTGGCYAVIQEAINATVDGDEILVAAGTYPEHLTIDHNVSIYGEGWENTIIHGNYSEPTPTLSISGVSASTIISGVQITGGGPGNITEEVRGGGIAIWYSSPKIINTWVNNCTAKYGGGIYVNGGSPVFENVPVWENQAFRGGGFYLLSTDVTISGDPFEGTNGTVLSNLASSDGGGFYVSDSSISMTGLRIYLNEGHQGGGMYIKNGIKLTSLWANHIFKNTAHGNSGGGGINTYQSNNLELVLNIIEENNSDISEGGGGANFNLSHGLVQSNLFINNTSAQGGGGASIVGNSEGPTIQGNWFENNAGGAGGGVYIGNQAAPEINANVIVSNTAGIGGGIYMWLSGESRITNNIIARNTKPAGPGGIGSGVAVIASPGVLINNTIADNHEKGIYFSEAEGTVIVNNIISGNTSYGIFEDPGSSTSDYTVDYNDVFGNSNPYSGGVIAGPNNISLDPLFIGSGDWFVYYHLQEGSPVSTTGSTSWAPGYDIDGDLRHLGGSVSMGADEIHLFGIFLPLLGK